MNIEDVRRSAFAMSALLTHCHGDERPDCPILDDLARTAAALGA
jgi:MerR family copper efflux transcriptional regulator